MDAEEKVDRTVEKAWKSACILRKIYKRKEGGIKNRKFDNTCVMCYNKHQQNRCGAPSMSFRLRRKGDFEKEREQGE